MSPIEWLCAKAFGFEELSQEERDAITHFSLLWSYFEAQGLDNCASARRIVDRVQRLEGRGRLHIVAFEEDLAYFRKRYFRNGAVTDNFHGLRFRPNDKQDLVEGVLQGRSTNQSDCISALLIVVYRLRNNLFHGNKWDEGLFGQLDNFTHANNVLMKVLDCID